MKKLQLILALVIISVAGGAWLHFSPKDILQTSQQAVPQKTSPRSDATTAQLTDANNQKKNNQQPGIAKPDATKITKSSQKVEVIVPLKPGIAQKQAKNRQTGPRAVTFDDLLDNPSSILLQQRSITTNESASNIPENLKFDPAKVAAGENVPYLVQFSGPILKEWKEAIVSTGAELLNYVPNNTFIVNMTEAEKASVAALPFVSWLDYYHPMFKISNNLVNSSGTIAYRSQRSQAPQQTTSQASTSGNTGAAQGSSETTVLMADADQIALEQSEGVILTVQSFHRGKLPRLQSLIASTQSGSVLKTSDTSKSRVRIQLSSADLQNAVETIAQDPVVEWIEPYVPPALHNNTMHWVVQSNVQNANPLWENGLTGAGQIVGVGDTGLDVDMAFFWDTSQGIPNDIVNPNQRKVIAYHDLAGNGDWDAHDHGTHVAGTIAGKSLGSNSAYNGIAYDAKLVIQDVGYGGSLLGIPNDLNTYFQQAYDNGARIHSNSWGASVSGAYTTMSQDADEFMWNHKDFFIVFSAGNSGPDTYTVGSPGTAKNILTSGASANAHSGYNQEDVAYFSSNGPTEDGRIKPTITAPGYYIVSADNDGNITTFNSGVQAMAGTSMSAPSHAGSAALVRQYYSDGYYPTGSSNSEDAFVPSSALIKATMVNSAVNMTGAYIDAPMPSTGQGWGRMLLDNTLFFAGDTQRLYIDDNQAGLETDEEEIYTFYASGSQPAKVTLCWTDYYPSLSAAIKLVNDLDLIVIGPGGYYLGNVLSGGVSVTGGSADRRNVEENVFLPTPTEGIYTVIVRGHNIPNGPQPYALVTTGLQQGSSRGTVSFDKSMYRGDSQVTILLNDLDLDVTSGLDTVQVHLSATSDPGQDIQLTELAESPGSFWATLALNTILTTSEGDTITVRYADANDGTGNAAEATDTASIDNSLPAISEINVTGVNQNSATVSWMTNEPVYSTLFYRASGETQWASKLSIAKQEHTETLTDLTDGTTYEFYLVATDMAANVTTDDNGGMFYTFVTDIQVDYWADTADSGSSLFSLSGGSDGNSGNGLWHLSSSNYYSPNSSWYYGQEGTASYDTGSHNWGHITTTAGIELKDVTNAYLIFRHILETEGSEDYDVGSVQISTDNTDFITVYQSIASSADWEEVSIDLSSYIGQTIWIRFSFDTVDELFNEYLGWYLDDIRISTYIQDDGLPPEAVSGVTIADPGDNSITLAWAANSEKDLKAYNVYRDTLLLAQIPPTKTNYTDTDTTKGTDYSYTITAIDTSNRESVHSETLSATAGIPETPADLSAVGAVDAVTLFWEQNGESDLAGYNVYTFTEATSSDDLALSSAGARVITPITHGSPNALIDGNSWDSKVTAKKWKGDIIIDLGKLALIERIGLHNYDGDTGFQRYTISTSIDNSSYQLAVDRSTGQNKNYIEDQIEPTPARYIKISCIYNSVGPNAVFREARVYGKPLQKLNETLVTGPTQYTVENLEYGKDYWYAVTAVDTFGNASMPTVVKHSLGLLDTDGDSIPDEWELAHGLDPFNPADALLDRDGDGISNLDEYLLSINAIATAEHMQDTDGDGLSDYDEVYLYGTSPFLWDTDGDKISDSRELELGTDPLTFSPIGAAPDPKFEFFTWTLPNPASATRLSLPADTNHFKFSSETGMICYGVHTETKPEGYEYIWFDLQENTPVLSWAEGTVAEISDAPDGSHIITIQYPDNLVGIHEHIAATPLQIGDEVQRGQVVGTGTALPAGTASSSFTLIDKYRTDGPMSPMYGGAQVSPFDYLDDTSKRTIIALYKAKVVSVYDENDPNSKIWGYDPAQPYLTNPINLFAEGTKRVSGVWQATTPGLLPPLHPENIVLLEANTPIYKGNVFFSKKTDADGAIETQSGEFLVNYSTGSIQLTDESGMIIYGIFTVDTSGSSPSLLIELSEKGPLTEFSANATSYILIE